MDAVNYNNDCLFQILMRVDPADISKCILVSKNWLEVITGEDFRTNYLNKWKGKLVVGLLVSDDFSAYNLDELMVPTTKLGREINHKTLVQEGSRIVSFMSKSPNSSHMLFIQKSYSYSTSPVYTITLYVWTGGPTIGSPLPPPPVYYTTFMANILSDEADASCYKVILAEEYAGENNSVNVQTFSSSTGQWEQSVLTCSAPFTMYPSEGSGAVAMGVVYWVARSRGSLRCLAAWNMSGGSSRISLILEPEAPSLLRIPFYEGGEIRKEQMRVDFMTYYGVSPNGSLLSATCTTATIHSYFDFELYMIKIFSFDDNTKDWSLLHQVRHGSIWTENLALLSSLFGVGDNLPDMFKFVSFVPGRVDAIFLGLKHHLFVYNFESHKLEHLDYSNPRRICFHPNRVYYHPLTLQDLGVWLSSPLSIKLEKHPSSSSVRILASCWKHTSSLFFMFLIMSVITAFLIG